MLTCFTNDCVNYDRMLQDAGAINEILERFDILIKKFSNLNPFKTRFEEC